MSTDVDTLLRGLPRELHLPQQDVLLQDTAKRLVGCRQPHSAQILAALSQRGQFRLQSRDVCRVHRRLLWGRLLRLQLRNGRGERILRHRGRHHTPHTPDLFRLSCAWHLRRGGPAPCRWQEGESAGQPCGHRSVAEPTN